MKILMVQKAKGFAGSENYLLKIIPKLKEKGIEVELLIIYETRYQKEIKDFVKPVEEQGIPFHQLEIKRNLSYRLLKDIHEIIKKNQYDIVHSHLPHADLWCGLVKFFFNSSFKLVSTKHSYDESYANEIGFINIKKRYDRFYWVSWLAEKFIDRSFCVSEALKRLFVELNICKKEKLDVIYHGIISKNDGVPSINKKHFAKHQLIMVGRLIDLKGHRFILKIMPRLIEQYETDICLLIAGNGTIKTKLEQMAIDLKVEKQVHFLGFRSDVFDLISQSDVSLCLSASEGFGLVILESFDAQTPVISFDVPACNEIIEHQKNGILIPPYDLNILYQEIVALIDHKTNAQQLIRKARKDLQEKFSFNHMVDQTIQFYHKVISNT